MKQLIKVSNNDLSFRLKLNYNNVYSRLKMLLGKSATLFADVKRMSSTTTWYSEGNEDYTSLKDAPEAEAHEILEQLNVVLKKAKKEIDNSHELSPYADDILEVPDNGYVFYHKADDGTYQFVLAGWGCKQAHTALSDTGGLIRRVSKSLNIEEEPVTPPRPDYTFNYPPGNVEGPATDKPVQQSATTEQRNQSGEKPDNPDVADPEPAGESTAADDVKPEQKKKKEQHVVLKVINQHSKPIEDEDVIVRTQSGEVSGSTDERGCFEIGNLPYHSSFVVSFPNLPNIKERAYEVEPKVEQYDAYIKKYINYSPVLFVEDQNGNVVDNYNVKVMIGGQDNILNTGSDGMIQLPTVQEGQKFVVIDSLNYANSEEYSVNQENVKKPFKFKIKRAVKTKVGITILNKDKKPIERSTVDINNDNQPCQQTTDKNGRAEFPSEIFKPGDVHVRLYVPGKGTIHSKLAFVPDITEYTIQLTGKPNNKFNWKWLLLLPLFLLLGLGGKYVYDHYLNPEQKVPTIAEMETGVVMIFGRAQYSIELNVPDIEVNGKKLDKAWIHFKDGEPAGYTYDQESAGALEWSGTGFLISKEDGLIATNRHVVEPVPNEDLVKHFRLCLQRDKEDYQTLCDNINDTLHVMGAYGLVNQDYLNARQRLQKSQEMVKILDKILNIGDFKINKQIRTFAAFTGTRVEYYDNLIALSTRVVGEPGGIDEKDVAIVQVSKKQDIPADAYVFTVPEVDLMDGEIPDDYDVTVLGYNAGTGLQNMKYQEAIKPQAQHGKINNKSEKYRIGYDAPTLGGSSGSPVLNKKGELIAINNSGFGTQGFNYGVRTKYLRELLDEMKNGKVNNSDLKEPSKKK